MAVTDTPAAPTRPAGGGRALLGRKWDLLLIISAILLVMAAFHVNNMLFVGDWSFWADWKDREFWPLLTPALGIIVPAALQYITWDQLRIPIGATFGALVLLLAEWLNRWVNWSGWAHIPVNFTWPETYILAAVIMDVILLVTRSYLITSVVGGITWGVLFWVMNLPLISLFLQPVNFHGTLMTVADVMSFKIVRTQTPEYMRIVEEGRLRALVNNVTVVVGVFAGMMSAGIYWIGLLIGKYLAVWPAGKFFKLQTSK